MTGFFTLDPRAVRRAAPVPAVVEASVRPLDGPTSTTTLVGGDGGRR